MSLYVICDPAKPAITLCSSPDLGVVVDALLAQARPLIVYRSQDGAATPLLDGDVERLRSELEVTHRVERSTPVDTAIVPLDATRFES